MNYVPTQLTLCLTSEGLDSFIAELKAYSGLAGRVLIPTHSLSSRDELELAVNSIRAVGMDPVFLLCPHLLRSFDVISQPIFTHRPAALIVRSDDMDSNLFVWINEFKGQLKSRARRLRRQHGNSVKFGVPPIWVWHSPCDIREGQHQRSLHWLDWLLATSRAHSDQVGHRARCFSGLIMPEPVFRDTRLKVGKRSLELVVDVAPDRLPSLLETEPDAKLFVMA